MDFCSWRWYIFNSFFEGKKSCGWSLTEWANTVLQRNHYRQSTQYYDYAPDPTVRETTTVSKPYWAPCIVTLIDDLRYLYFTQIIMRQKSRKHINTEWQWQVFTHEYVLLEGEILIGCKNWSVRAKNEMKWSILPHEIWREYKMRKRPKKTTYQQWQLCAWESQPQSLHHSVSVGAPTDAGGWPAEDQPWESI